MDTLYVCGDALVDAVRARINTLALGARLPTIYPNREYLQAGGLMSYGPNFPDLFRRAADYVDKILHGAKSGGRWWGFPPRGCWSCQSPFAVVLKKFGDVPENLSEL